MRPRIVPRAPHAGRVVPSHYTLRMPPGETPNTGRSLCVFCSSSDHVDGAFFEAARALGALIGRRGDMLVYGGGRIGLMGEIARAVHAVEPHRDPRGRVVGVIPESMRADDVDYADADELIWTDHMRTRKHAMDQRADAFVALPGGLGTLEELAEIVVLKQLQYHQKPVVILNAGGFYDPLLALFDHMIDARFAKPEVRDLWHVCGSAEGVYAYLDGYAPGAVGSKFA